MLKHLSTNVDPINKVNRPNGSLIHDYANQYLSPPITNISLLNSSKHSVGNNSGSLSAVSGGNRTKTTGLDHSHLSVDTIKASRRLCNGGLDIPPDNENNAGILSRLTFPASYGVKEMLTSLGLLCIVSLLLSLLALIFLLKITPVIRDEVTDKLVTPDDFITVEEVTLGMVAFTLSLDMCCLLVCAIQLLSGIRLMKTDNGPERTSLYLRHSSVSRVCAIGGFFLSIPLFLIGVILYTFLHFHSTPAIVTCILIGLGIVFCGTAMVHNVYIWQKDKIAIIPVNGPTPNSGISHITPTKMLHSTQIGIPSPTLDLSGQILPSPHELSTLV